MRNRQDESAQRKRDYPADRADRHMTFRFDEPIDLTTTPAVIAETEARIRRMFDLQRAAWAAKWTEEDPFERRGAMSAIGGSGVEIGKLYDHLDRLRVAMGLEVEE